MMDRLARRAFERSVGCLSAADVAAMDSDQARELHDRLRTELAWRYHEDVSTRARECLQRWMRVCERAGRQDVGERYALEFFSRVEAYRRLEHLAALVSIRAGAHDHAIAQGRHDADRRSGVEMVVAARMADVTARIPHAARSLPA